MIHIHFMLKTNNTVIRIADDNHVTSGLLIAPCIRPKIEYRVQVDGRQNRENNRVLQNSTLSAGMFLTIQHANLQPFSDEPQHALVLYSVLKDSTHPLMVHGIKEPADICIKHPVHFPLSFTNNRAERDLRISKVKQKASDCFRAVEYAHAYCHISSYRQTIVNQGYNPLIAIQMTFTGKIGESLHLLFIDPFAINAAHLLPNLLLGQ